MAHHVADYLRAPLLATLQVGLVGFRSLGRLVCRDGSVALVVEDLRASRPLIRGRGDPTHRPAALRCRATLAEAAGHPAEVFAKLEAFLVRRCPLLCWGLLLHELVYLLSWILMYLHLSLSLNALRKSLPVRVHNEAVVVDVDVLGGVVDVCEFLDAVYSLDVENSAFLIARCGFGLGHDVGPAAVKDGSTPLEACGAVLAAKLLKLVLRLRVGLPLLSSNLAHIFDDSGGSVLSEPFALNLLDLLPLHQRLLVSQFVAGDEDLLAFLFLQTTRRVSGAVGRLRDLPKGNVRVE